MPAYQSVAYNDSAHFLYGKAKEPLVFRNRIALGGGLVYPEINFSLPPMEITQETMPEVRQHYTEMIEGVLRRATELQLPGLVVEIELLPPLTENATWGTDIVRLVRERMWEYEESGKLPSILRLTPNDIRDMERPPRMRSGHLVESMLQSFAYGAAAGADLLSIESTGGKEVCDEALLYGDLPAVIVALGIMGTRDMAFLWDRIVEIAEEHDVVPAGDTACAFANTAMMLAEKGYIPRTFAAVVRVVTAVRSLVAYERGATGPSKDCAYEGPYIKAITGLPISMEGKSAACAHLSPLGNIAAAVCDLWSNESVQNVRLLGATAPVVSLEQLAYDCRLMNTAGKTDEGRRKLQQWLVHSDRDLDPQAYVLDPEVVIRISRELVNEKDHYRRTRLAASLAIEELCTATRNGKLQLNARETQWLAKMGEEIDSMPDDGISAWELIKERIDTSRFRPEEYELG